MRILIQSILLVGQKTQTSQLLRMTYRKNSRKKSRYPSKITFFRIFQQFGDIITNLNQQLRDAKSQERSLMEDNFNLKIEVEKLVLGDRYLSDRIANTEKLLESRYETNINTASLSQVMDSSINASTHILIPERHEDAQLCHLNYSKQAAKQTLAILVKEVQAIKHEEYLVYNLKYAQRKTKSSQRIIGTKNPTDKLKATRKI